MQPTRDASGTSCKMCAKCCYYEVPLTILDVQRVAGGLAVAPREAFERVVAQTVSARSGLLKMRKGPDGACVR